MATPREDLKQENKQNVQLNSGIYRSNIPISDYTVKDLTSLASRTKEEDMILMKKLAVMKAIEPHMNFLMKSFDENQKKKTEQETKLLEMGSENVATADHFEKKLEAEKEKCDQLSVEIENIKLEDCSKMGGPERNVGEPEKAYVQDDNKGKGKGKIRV